MIKLIWWDEPNQMCEFRLIYIHVFKKFQALELLIFDAFGSKIFARVRQTFAIQTYFSLVCYHVIYLKVSAFAKTFDCESFWRNFKTFWRLLIGSRKWMSVSEKHIVGCLLFHTNWSLCCYETCAETVIKVAPKCIVNQQKIPIERWFC